jgi:hypothetical protein
MGQPNLCRLHQVTSPSPSRSAKVSPSPPTSHLPQSTGVSDLGIFDMVGMEGSAASGGGGSRGWTGATQASGDSGERARIEGSLACGRGEGRARIDVSAASDRGGGMGRTDGSAARDVNGGRHHCTATQKRDAREHFTASTPPTSSSSGVHGGTSSSLSFGTRGAGNSSLSSSGMHGASISSTSSVGQHPVV